MLLSNSIYFSANVDYLKRLGRRVEGLAILHVAEIDSKSFYLMVVNPSLN
ncbi:hypothetical protein PSAC2689_50191 [Paraburkholderia sacchari]